MSWQPFLLGRPGYEYTFSAPPDAFTGDWTRLSSDQRNLAGNLKERVVKTWLPTVTLKSDWFPFATDLLNIYSLLSVTDTFLSFITRNDWAILLEPNIATSVSTVAIQNTPAALLSAAYAVGGYGSTPTKGTISITGVWTSPAGTGTNYYTGGSYLDSTNTITLGTNLPAAAQVYVSYTFPGWMVRMKKLTTQITGGRIDLFQLGDLQLDGV